MVLTIRLQSEPFDPGSETNHFLAATAGAGAGAAVTFTGLVRSGPGEQIHALTLEHYPDLAEAELTRIAERAAERFGLDAILIIHRHGRLLPGEVIVFVGTLAGHRRAAFEGAEFVMDYLKTDAPFWKKEERQDGERWIEARSDDDRARNRWETR